MLCIKCKKEIPNESVYCLYCGKKQKKTEKKRTRKRPHGTGTISRDNRHKKPWTAHAPYHNGKRLYLGNYASAKEAQMAIDAYIRDGHSQSQDTLQEVYQAWSEVHYQQVSQSAINLYCSTWKHFSEIQQLRMCDIKTPDFQKIVNQAKSKSACQIIKILAGLLCKYAIENDMIQKNYADFIKIPLFEKKEKKIFSQEDLTILWQNQNDKRVQMILFMIYTGLRIGELAMLKISDINLENNYLICGEKTKAGKNRIVPLPVNIPEITEFIKNWIQQAESDNLLGLTVSQIRNQYFYPALVDLQLVTPVAKSHGRYVFESEHYTPHSTRHTFASISASVGMQPENLQKIIGHANFSTTAEIYIHQDIKTLCTEMEKLRK
ncbi:MAG: site-specific integrase [Oscillospiraceae bacterium]|nr:site-specific integrase [Oscillospiraceae bacterium]